MSPGYRGHRAGGHRPCRGGGARRRTHARQLLDAARLSFVEGWQEAMWVGAAVMAALFLVIALRGPENAPRRPGGPGADDGTVPATGSVEETAAR